MIPATNYDDDDNYNITISSYTNPETTYNYLNYKINKTASQSQQFLYNSQIRKENNLSSTTIGVNNQFTLTYNNETDLFDFTAVNCSLDILMIPSAFVFMDTNNNITNSNNNINFKIDETLGSDALLFSSLVFQNGLSNESKLNISNRFINLETIILDDNYFKDINISHLQNLKYISPIKGKNITLTHLLNLKSVVVDSCDEVTIEDCDSLKNIEINKAKIANINGISHLKRCVGKSVDKLNICNIMNLDDEEKEEVNLLDFRNTEQVIFMNEENSRIKVKYCYLNCLVPSKSTGCTNPIVNIEVLYIPSIFYYDNDNEIYKPLFSTSHNKTQIEVLNFTGGDMFYDDDIHTYQQGYNPSCVTTINFTSFYDSYLNRTHLTRIYRNLFYGSQTREVYINAPIQIPAHYFDNEN